MASEKIQNILEEIKNGGSKITLVNKTKNFEVELELPLSDRQADILAAGGLLNYTRKNG